MLLATTFDERTNKTETTLFDSWNEYHKSVFSPAIDTLSIIPLSVHGKTYAERKASAEQIAIDFSHCECYGISYMELAIVSAFFEKIGKRYGLLSIFRENCIC